MEIKEVRTQKELVAFINFPFELYKGNKFWTGELKADTKKLLTSDPFWRHAKKILFLAYNGSRIVGRIAAVINAAHNEYWKENAGFFGFFDCADDMQAARALFDAAENFLRAEGAAFIRGPFNPSTNHTCGVLLDNYDTRPFIMMPYNFDYYPRLIESAGLHKVKDLLAFERTKEHRYSDRVKKIMARIDRSSAVKLRPISLKNLDSEIETVRQIYNASWAGNWGFIPINPDEIKAIADELKMILVPETTAIAELDGKAVGFYISIPDMNSVLNILRGGLWNPWRLVRALIAWRRIKQCRMIMLGVHPDYRGRGAELMLIRHIIDNGIAYGWYKAELSWILEDNTDIIKVITETGCTQTKRYRIYEKQF